MLMNVEYSYSPLQTFAQAYGTDSYGAQTYSCQEGETACTTVEAPNTGFLGMSQDVAVGFGVGSLLVVVAIISTAVVLVSRAKRNKAKAE